MRLIFSIIIIKNKNKNIISIPSHPLDISASHTNDEINEVGPLPDIL